MTNDNYLVIGKLQLSPIEGAKTLQMGIYEGMPFAVSLDTDPNKLYAIFLPDGQLSEEYAVANDCVGYTTGTIRKGGFFGKNRKVRSIKLMSGKITSVGYVADLDSLKFTGYDVTKLTEGQYISELNGVQLVSKFVNDATRYAIGHGRYPDSKHIATLPGLKMHPNTDQFYRNKHKIQVGDLITLTYKLDGTSVRAANVEVPLPKTAWQNFFEMWSPYPFSFKPKMVRKVVTGTHRMLLLSDEDKAGLDIYTEFGNRLEGKLHIGESVYAEIVGWYGPEKPLFNRGGQKFVYGQQPGTREHYVYAIKWTLPDGTEMQLPWTKMKQRCLELGLKTVPTPVNGHQFIYFSDEEAMNKLTELVTLLAEGPDELDPTHLKEGIVVRVENADGDTFFLKYKSPEYLILEDKSKNDDTYVDLEELQAAA